MSAPVSASSTASSETASTESAAATPDPVRVVLPGLEVMVARVPGPPLVAARLWVRGGARREELPGQALITGRALSEGSRRRDWLTIADQAESLGMSLSSSGGFDAHGLSVDALARDWEQALEWAAELLLEPGFPEERCDWLRRQAAAELDSLMDQPDARTARAFQEVLYGDHPRSRPLQGGAEALAALTVDHCRRFHAKALREGVVLAVVGDLDEDAVVARLRDLFAPLTDAADASGILSAEAAAAAGLGPGMLPEPPARYGAVGTRRRVPLPPAGEQAQAHLAVGCLTTALGHPDQAALEVLGVILGAGAGLTGRLPDRVREKEGLAYAVQVHPLSGAGLDPGHLAVGVGTSPATLDQAERAVVEELERLLEDGVAEEELIDARAYLLGREPFRRETARQVADLLVRELLYRLPGDPELRRRELEAVTADEVLAVARRHLVPGRWTVVSGVPEAGAPEGAATGTAAESREPQ